MARIKEDKKKLSTLEKEELKRLEAESDRILDQLKNDLANRELIDRLNQVDVAYMRLSGEKTMEY